MTGTLGIIGGKLHPVSEYENNADWGLRKLTEAPDGNYVEEFEYDLRSGRQITEQYFYCKVDGKYGKGVLLAPDRIEIFMNASPGRSFCKTKEDPSFMDWLRWYFRADKPIYMK